MSNIRVTLNPVRSELLLDGWSKTIESHGFSFCRFTSSNKYREADVPDEFWQEPTTGVLLLRPKVLKANYWEVDSSSSKLNVDAWRHDSSQGLFSIDGRGDFYTQRESSGFPLIQIEVAVALAAINAYMGSQMVWVMETKDQLAINEGFSFWVHPFGIYTNRAEDYMLIGFGGRFCLHLQMNGRAKLWAYVDSEWSEVQTFRISEGGCDHTKPFQITVIPFGTSSISFVFSNHSGSAAWPNKSFTVSTRTAGFINDFDVTTNQWIKTKAAPLSVALRKNNHQYGFSWARVQYSTDPATAYLSKRTIGEIHKLQTPEVTAYGYYGQQATPAATPTALAADYVNSENAEWDSENDIEIVAKVEMSASSDGKYTPELWYLNYDVPEQLFEPDWTGIDISSQVREIEIESTVSSDPSSMTIKYNDDGNEANLFKRDGPIRVEVKSIDGLSWISIFDGYIEDIEPTPDGIGGKMLVKTLKCRDMWARLEETKVGDCRSLSDMNVGDAIDFWIKRGGFKSNEIETRADSEWIDSEDLKIEGWIEKEDEMSFVQPEPNATIGDVLRQLVGVKGIQNREMIRLRWTGDRWVKSGPSVYNPATPPILKMFLSTDLLPAWTGGDAERWAQGLFIVKSKPEYKFQLPDFNKLKLISIPGVSAKIGVGTGAVPMMCESVVYDHRAIEDATYMSFQGRVRSSEKGPPAFGGASGEDNDRQARHLFAQRGYMKHLLSLRGEWQPPIDADDIFWIVGKNTAGQRVSYGAWRIASMQKSITSDIEETTFSTRHTWNADYKLVYVGPAEDGDTPMFTELLP